MPILLNIVFKLQKNNETVTVVCRFPFDDDDSDCPKMYLIMAELLFLECNGTYVRVMSGKVSNQLLLFVRFCQTP